MKQFEVGGNGVDKVTIGKDLPLVLIGGPCVIESEDHALFLGEKIKEVCNKYGVQYIFKGCYDKDCRSSIKSFHGLGIEEGLNILSRIRTKLGVPVTSDFSVPEWAAATGEVCDLVQIPAYLCRQTQMLVAAGKTQKPINIKKGQYMSPWNMRNSIRKIIEATNNDQILLTERGTFFGYNMLVNDMRSLPIMQDTGYPVCYDATHSIQLPTSQGSISGGQREFIPGLVRAAVSSGVQALFMEIHDDPDNALSDPATQMNLKYLEPVLAQANEFHKMNLELRKKWGEDDVK